MIDIEQRIRSVLQHNEVKRFVDEIRKKHPDWSWTQGGCFAFAEALKKAFGAELWVVAQKEDEDWASQHAFVRYEGKFYDATGEVTEEQLLEYGWDSSPVKIGPVDNWDDELSLWYPVQEFVSLEEIYLLSRLLKKGANNFASGLLGSSA
jgi:hypothetical protein